MKKLVSVMLVLVMVLTCLAGCGGGKDNGGNAGGGEKADTFKIGGIGPTTGGAAIYGKAVENAAKIAVDEINAAGGINGKQIEFNFQDDEHTPEKAVNAYNTLKGWGMQILMGTVTSKPCLSVTAETKKDNMFQVTPSASAPNVLLNGNVMQICFSDDNQGSASAQYIGENKLATKVAVIYDSSDVYSTGILKNFELEAANQSFKIVAKEAFDANNKTDFTTQIQKAKSEGADLVFLPIYYDEAALILQAAKDINYAPAFFGCDGMDGILSKEGFDTSLAEGLMLLTPFAADSEEQATVDFVKKYKEAYNGEVPNQFAADAYDAMYALKQAMEMAKVTPDMSISAICDALVKVMPEVKIQGITGGETGLAWDATGAVTKEPKAVKIQNGVYVAMQ